jgi:hypothetical protein
MEGCFIGFNLSGFHLYERGLNLNTRINGTDNPSFFPGVKGAELYGVRWPQNPKYQSFG